MKTGMRMIALGSRSFVSGFQLAGVLGMEVDSSSDALKAIKQLASDKDVALIVIGDDVAKPIRGELTSIKAKQAIPLIYEVPSPGSKQERMEYMDMLKQILGV